MANKWPMVRLGDFVDSSLGKMLDTQKNKGVPRLYLGNSNVRWGSFDLNDLALMKFQEDEEERYGILDGDLIICEGGEPGRCAIWREQIPEMKIQKALHRIRTKNNLNNYYLLYWFILAARSEWLEPFFTGTTIKHLTGKALNELKVPLPPIKEQDAIANILCTLDDKIELNRRTNGTLETMARTLFKAWFVDFEPVRAKMEGRWQRDQSLPGLPAHLYDIFPGRLVESELGEIPEGWECGAISDLATFQNGYAFKTKDWQDSGHPIVKIGNIKPGLIDITGASCVSPTVVVNLERFKLDRGDLLVGMTGYVGETGLVPSINPPAYLNQRVGKISTKRGVTDLGFVYCLVRNPDYKVYAELKSHGSAQANISGADLMAYPCVLPEENIMNTFNKILCPMILDILGNHDISSNLVTIRDTLLPKLISGELRIHNAEAFLKERGL